ncbi:hypothetical protein HU200_000746 [Digitaria exilis]|uniref:Uncharacterized protein n=1 Tax=Digitaria exilis TaxID=1010633 RepID=A0A835FZ69_9POAL|nr:hypothetical protein HU200_000746 [Digitaria exilis]
MLVSIISQPENKRTAKTLRNEGRIDYTRGVSREQRAINRRNNLGWADAAKRRRLKWLREQKARETAVANYEKNLCALEEERFGEVLYDGEVLDFVETPFGFTVKPGDPGQTNDDFDRVLPSIVVSLALFDGNKMIFACSGIPLPRGKDGLVLLTRFVTSAHLVKAFKVYRNRDDNLRVEVRLPDNKTTDGFLGLYDDDIAIVTCLGRLDVCPIDLNFKEKPAAPSCPGDSLAGRAFMSGSLMAMHGSPCKLCNSTWIPDDQRNFKAVLGGPLIQKDAGFIGLIYDFYYDHGDAIVRYSFLSLELLCERLDRFEILNPFFTPLRLSYISAMIVFAIGLFSLMDGYLIDLRNALVIYSLGKGILMIEVFLPPNQRGSGTLEFYNLNYNIAIISVKKNFNAVRAEDIFSKTVEKPSDEELVSIGRDTIHGP